jgi:hypothetical protein
MDKNEQNKHTRIRTTYVSQPPFAIADACVVEYGDLLKHVFRDRFKATR